MKIDRLETVHLRYEYPASEQFEYAGGRCTGRLTTLVRVHADTGLIGTGSAYSHPGMVELVVRQQLEPLLRGDDPQEIDALWRKMYGITRWYGRKGAVMSALGAIDTACWDLHGQALDTPVWKLLGGSKATCPAYASALLWKDAAALAAEATDLIQQGYRRVKMRLGYGGERDMAAVRAVRDAIGPDNDLLVDGSMRYTLPEALELARTLKESDVFWFEEPFAPEDIDLFAALRGLVAVPLAAGENEFGFQGFRELIRAGCVDIVQPDVSRCGGITETLRIGRLAQAAGLKLATHSWCDAVAIVANAHVVAAMPCGLTVEVDRTGTPLVDELLVEPLRVCEGRLTLSDAPGLGVELNQAVVNQYRIDDVFDIPDGNYSDMVFGRAHFSPPESLD